MTNKTSPDIPAHCGNCEGASPEAQKRCDWHEAANEMMAACVALIDYDDGYHPNQDQLGVAVEFARDALAKVNN